MKVVAKGRLARVGRFGMPETELCESSLFAAVEQREMREDIGNNQQRWYDHDHEKGQKNARSIHEANSVGRLCSDLGRHRRCPGSGT
jgi:hypothetical protein